MLYKSSTKERRTHRVREKLRNRKNIERPRLSVFCSNHYIYAQIIDDVAQSTVVSASSLEKAYREVQPQGYGSNCKAADWVGQMVAKRAVDQGLKEVIFDRGGYQFHGKVKALADAARNSGLKF